jgi:hypothetical protein
LNALASADNAAGAELNAFIGESNAQKEPFFFFQNASMV